METCSNYQAAENLFYKRQHQIQFQITKYQ